MNPCRQPLLVCNPLLRASSGGRDRTGGIGRRPRPKRAGTRRRIAPSAVPWLVLLIVVASTGCQDPPSLIAPAERPAFDLAAQGLAAYTPVQAVLLDGSSDAYAIAFSEEFGYQLGFGNVLALCGDVPQPPRGERYQVFEARGVMPIGIVPGDLVSAPDPKKIPAELEGLTDCELRDHWETIKDYLDAVAAEVEQIVAQSQACLATVSELYCRVVDAIKNAPTGHIPGFEIALDAGSSAPSAPQTPLGPVLQECYTTLQVLHQFPGWLEYLEFLGSRCGAAREALESIEQEVESKIAGKGGLTEQEKDGLLAGAKVWLSVAENAAAGVAQVADAVLEARDAITEESIEASCAACVSLDAIFQGLVLSGAVQVHSWRQPVGRYIGALQSAANQADDPELAANLADLAGRLAQVENDRVLQVIYPTGSAIGQEFVAVRAPNAPPDPLAPLVVILTGLPDGSPLPPPNAADLKLLFEVFREFRRTVEPERR